LPAFRTSTIYRIPPFLYHINGAIASPKPAQLRGHKPEVLRQWVDEKVEESKKRSKGEETETPTHLIEASAQICDALEDVDNTLDWLEDV
jgi:hypothetical protein